MLDPRNIIRTNKRTLSLFVNVKGELIVRAPYKYPDYKIFEFVKGKEEWIRKKQAAIRNNSYINQSVICYNSYFFLGQELSPVISANVKDFVINSGVLYIPAKIPAEKILSKVERWYKKAALDIITERADYFRTRLRLSPEEISVNNNKTRWGVCDSHNRIAINWRAVLLPPNLLDYIIVHEFCHLLEFNHTKNFWAIVSTIIPDWRAVRIHLKRMGYLLMLFRPN